MCNLFFPKNFMTIKKNILHPIFRLLMNQTLLERKLWEGWSKTHLLPAHSYDSLLTHGTKSASTTIRNMHEGNLSLQSDPEGSTLISFSSHSLIRISIQPVCLSQYEKSSYAFRIYILISFGHLSLPSHARIELEINFMTNPNLFSILRTLILLIGIAVKWVFRKRYFH